MTRPKRMGGGSLATQHAPPLDLPFRFLATALAALAVLAVIYPWHTPLLLGSFYDPRLLAFVHVNTLGVIAATIIGASFQLLPVVIQTPLASVRLARLSWWLYVPGLVLFPIGLASGLLPLMGLGGTLLFLAIALYVVVVARTLAQAPERDVVFWHIAAALVGLSVGVTLGLTLAFTKSGGLLGGWTLPILAAHATLMLGAWVTPMLTGVAFRLVGMFTLREDAQRHDWAWIELALVVGGAWTLAASLLLGLAGTLGVVAMLALLGGLGLFLAQIVRLYRIRLRRSFDIHVPFALTATTFGLLAGLLLLFGLAGGRGPSDPLWLAAGWLAIAGWAETAIQGFLYKIGTFLTWLHRYAPLAGRQRVPKLEDMYGRRTAVGGWLGWTAGVALVALAALTGSGALALAGALGLSLGAVLFVINAVRVGAHWRGPRQAAQSATLTPQVRA